MIDNDLIYFHKIKIIKFDFENHKIYYRKHKMEITNYKNLNIKPFEKVNPRIDSHDFERLMNARRSWHQRDPIF